MATPFDLDAAVDVLESLGLDARVARAELESIPDDEAPEDDVAALVVESEAGVHFDTHCPVEDGIVELVDAFRRAGIPCRLETFDDAPVVVVEQEGVVRAHRIVADDGLTHEVLAAAVVRVLPSGYSLRLCPGSSHGDSLAIAVLSSAEESALEAVMSAEALERVLPRPSATRVHSYVTAVAVDALKQPDWDERFAAYCAPNRSGSSWAEAWERVARCDPSIPWPQDESRPAGDACFELTHALCGEPLAACCDGGERSAWANLLYRWALATQVGARWDRLACRYNPGASAQGILGHGQLTWAWFIFDAMDARAEADEVGALLDESWVRAQERSVLSVRQRAWFDLGSWLRSGDEGAQLGRLYELVELADGEAWRDAGRVSAALKLHSELRGDQFTHHPLYWCWPAPLYSIARRADVLDRLSGDNPFLRNAVSRDDVDMDANIVVGLKAFNAKLDAIEARRLPPLLDPLPVIVDVKVTHVDDLEVCGRTVLGGADGEHDVRAPNTGDGIAEGELWSLMVEDSIKESAPVDDGGDGGDGGDREPRLQRVAIPTGRWLERIG